MIDGENPMLDALMALQNEGTRGEVAQNFREQGNEAAREKRWGDAKEFYTKAVAVLKVKEDQWDKPADLAEEKRLLREVEEAVFVNRALCNLELSMSSLSFILPNFSRRDVYMYANISRKLPLYNPRLRRCPETQP